MASRTALALFAAAALGAGALAATPAHATQFTGSINLVDNTPDHLTFSGTGTIDWNQTKLNTWTHYDSIMSYKLDPSATTGYYDDEIEADFTFLLPDNQVVTHTGDANDTVFKVWGFVGSYGDITWDQPNPFTIDFTTGDQISLRLDPGVFGQGGYNDTGVLSVEVEQTKVPEPMSLALFGVGLAGLGMVARRRSRSAAAAA